MKLPADAARRFFAFGLTALALTGCGIVGGGADRPAALAASADIASRTGPGADFPVVLGDPFTVDGQLYTPADTLNYDVVGYAAVDDGAGITLAHRTLPLPSYVEVTALDSGKTILVRAERRGPMSGAQFVALSPDAAAQLGVAQGAPVRIRRVNALEKDRAELRAGRSASDRIATPKALADVLRRKLPASGWASLRATAPTRPAAVAVSQEPEQPQVATAAPVAETSAVAVAAYPLKPLAASATAARPKPVATRPVPVSFSLKAPPKASPVASVAAAPMEKAVAVEPKDGFVVQAGAFSNRSNAVRAAEALGGFVSPLGKLFRVRTGPFASRGQAEAALAKVRAAGYSDARVYTAG